MKLSVIGSGGWGRRVIPKFHHLCGVHLACGRSNREQLHRELGIDFTENIDELIDQSDAVVVAAPPQVHYELGKKVLAAGKDLWMEKPIAMNSRDAVEMAEMADGSDLIVLVGHLEPIRKPLSRTCRRLVDKQRFLNTNEPAARSTMPTGNSQQSGFRIRSYCAIPGS